MQSQIITLRTLFLLVLFALLTHKANSQSLQINYDTRHTLDPKNNAKNFATLQFEFYHQLDTGKTLIKPGAFFLKMQADMLGNQSNIGKFYMQVSQELRFWRPKVFINLQYSGGLGVTEPRQYSYYIQNTYQAGISWPFKFGAAFFTSVLNYKYVTFTKPSHDFFYTLYYYKGLWNYRAELAGDFSVGTENKNHGDELTNSLTGKRLIFFAEPQLWINMNKTIAFGTKMNMYYHILTYENHFQIYPTIGLRAKL